MAVTRYSRVAIALHWAIALAVLAMIPMGWWMAAAAMQPEGQQAAYRVFQLHKSVGFTILGLTAVRLGWRLAHPAPPLPESMRPWERFAAHAVHAAFYGLLFALPLTGWLYVSTGWSAGHDQPLAVATSWFGLVPVPHLPGVAEAGAGLRRALAHGAMGAHGLMAWGAAILVVLHAGAALKHQFVDRDGVLAHMAPWLKTAAPGEEPAAGTGPWRRAAPMLAGLGLVATLAVAGWIAARPAPLAQGAPAEPPGVASPAAAAPGDDAVEPGRAAAWAIDRAASAVRFSGTQAGAAFSGRFEDWRGHVWFDPEDLEGSRATVLVDVASARTGDATQEGSLRQAEWFDPARFPTARFEAAEFRRLDDGRFEARGTLRVKSRVVPVVLPFTFSVADGVARVEGSVVLDRTELDLGLASDPTAAWVSRAIQVDVTVSARPVP